MSAPDNMNGDQNAARRRHFVDIVTTLGSMGLTKELDLPQLACIGSQSVGKSSLIEALAGITLPRQSGTCTRCPIECRLKYTQEAWEARISLRIQPNDSNSAGPIEVPFGDPILDRNLVGARIGQAQRAVLNPNIDPMKFLSDEFQPKGPSFTNNCVIVALYGSELSDLNFVDLPGLISTTSDKSTDGDIQLVEQLVSSYISRSSVFILLVVSCQADFQTQGAVRLARDHDPQGKRTIGVLTKPDRIEEFEDGPWVSMVIGKENPLKNGWFCVKLPSSSDLRAKITPSDARAKEQKFFKTTAPWSGLAREYWGRFGTTNLGHRLGEILAIEIQARLPAIRSEVDRLIRENDLNLKAYPSPGGGKPRATVCRLIDGFVEDVKINLIQGEAGAGRKGLIQLMNQLYDRLRTELQQSALVYKPPLSSGGLARPGFLPDDEDWLSSSPADNEHSLEEIIDVVKWARTREFHGDYPFAVKKQLILRVVDLWRQPVHLALVDAETTFREILSKRIEKHFQAYQSGGLKDAVRDIVLDTLESCKFKTTEQLDFLLDQESEPNTVHEGLFRSYKEQFLAYYKDVFTPSYALNKLSKVLELGKEQLLQTALGPALEAAGLLEVEVDDLKRLLPLSEPNQNAIEIMASTSAHSQIAYRRFSDNVPLTIDQHFIRGFGRQLRDALHEGLHISDQAPEAYFEELLRESDTTVAYRKELLEKKNRLAAARVELM